MKNKKQKYRRAFVPSNPQDHHRSQIESMNWYAELEEERAREQQEMRRFIITTAISVVAAVAAIVAAVASIISCFI